MSTPPLALAPSILDPIVSRVRTDVHWVKSNGHPVSLKTPLTEAHLAGHLNGGSARGVCPIHAGQSSTRLALFDLDAHKGETPWSEMTRTAALLIHQLRKHGLAPQAFRSSGGNGIHVFLLWDEEQDAYSVRQFLRSVLEQMGFSDGAKGVKAREIEVFPKQDHVPLDGYGNMFVLPLAGASVPLWEAADLEPMPKEWPIDWHVSQPVPAVDKPERPMRDAVAPSLALASLRDALQAIPNGDEGTDSLGYDDWFRVVCGIYYESGGSDEGLGLVHEFSARSSKYDAAFIDERVWPYVTHDRANPITGGTILKLAASHDWEPDYSKEWTPLPPASPEEEAEQIEIQKRNAVKFARAARIAQAAIERAKFTGGRDALEAERREFQKRENEKIGEGQHLIPAAEIITLESAINRFVFLSDGSRVADVFNPHYDLAFADWAATHKASKESMPQPDKELANGKVKKMPDKDVAVSELWLASPRRQTVVCRTFKAGGGLMLPDPDGRRALNTWKPFDRSVEVHDVEATGIGLFLDHVRFLFGDDAERFLDWLAHIEQRPDVLPHTAWLHIAKNFGMGRNWLASVLSRVWGGAVAANLDLVALLGNGFNGRLSRKVLAIVDEIREGGRDSQWEHSEKLKSVITEETRLINPKYGRQSMEYNACRWLMFSNHVSAIPLETGDRRFEVVCTDAMPRDAAYYTRLYNALQDKVFIAAVAQFFLTRDLSRFNPGAIAANTTAKQAVTRASQTPTAQWCEMVANLWPSDVIASAVLAEIVAGAAEAPLTAAHRRTLEQFGMEAWGKTIKVDGAPIRVTIVRNKEQWRQAQAAEVREELKRGGAPTTAGGLIPVREYLDGLDAVG